MFSPFSFNERLFFLRYIDISLSELHGQGDALLGHVYRKDFDAHHIAERHHLGGVFDEALGGELGDMHKAILVHADVHERAEIGDVAHRAGENHVGLEVVDGQHILSEHGGVEGVTNVAAGLLQFADDVQKGGLSHVEFGADLSDALLFDAGREVGEVPCADVVLGVVEHGEQRAGTVVGFGVDTGVVQNLRAAGDAQKAGALLVGFGADAGHLGQLGTGAEGAVFLAVAHDVFGRGDIDARDVGKQGVGRSVDIHADRVDAGFDHAAERLVQSGGLHVVLVLADADALGVDLDQFGQRVLQTARDGDRRALHDVKLGEFLGGEFAGRVDGGTGLADDDVLGLARKFAQNVRDELLALAGGGAVADGDHVHIVGANQAFDHPTSLLDAGFDGGVDDRGVQHLARGVNHGQFASVGVPGVETQHHFSLQGRGHEQVAEVVRKDLDGALTSVLEQVIADLALDGGGDEAAVTVGHGGDHIGFGGGGMRSQHTTEQEAGHDLLGNGEGDLQKLLFLAAVDGQNAVAGNLFDRLGIVVVGGVYRVLLLGGFGGNGAVFHRKSAEFLAVLGVVRHVLGDDVHGALQGLLGGVDLPLGVDVSLGLEFNGGVIGLELRHNEGGQRFQPPLTGNRGAGTALGPIGAVDVVHLGDGMGVVNGKNQLGGEFALRVDVVFDFILTPFQIAQSRQTLVKGTQDIVVQTPRNLFAVAGDEGDGVALVNQSHGFFDLVGG